MIFFGETSLRRDVTDFFEHYHVERNHQGLDNQIIEPGDEVGAVAGKIECRGRLGGFLRYYYRDWAWRGVAPARHVQCEPTNAVRADVEISREFELDPTLLSHSRAEIRHV